MKSLMTHSASERSGLMSKNPTNSDFGCRAARASAFLGDAIRKLGARDRRYRHRGVGRVRDSPAPLGMEDVPHEGGCPRHGHRRTSRTGSRRCLRGTTPIPAQSAVRRCRWGRHRRDLQPAGSRAETACSFRSANSQTSASKKEHLRSRVRPSAVVS